LRTALTTTTAVLVLLRVPQRLHQLQQVRDQLLVRRRAQRVDRERPHDVVLERLARAQELERVGDVDVAPLGQQFPHLPDFRLDAPVDREQELGQRLRVALERVPELPHEFAIARRELVGRRRDDAFQGPRFVDVRFEILVDQRARRVARERAVLVLDRVAHEAVLVVVVQRHRREDRARRFVERRRRRDVARPDGVGVVLGWGRRRRRRVLLLR